MPVIIAEVHTRKPAFRQKAERVFSKNCFVFLRDDFRHPSTTTLPAYAKVSADRRFGCGAGDS